MSTISGVGDGASSLLAMLQERLAAETESNNAGSDKDKTAKTAVAAANSSPGQSSGSFLGQLTSAVLSELVQMQEQSATASGDASPGAAGSDQSNAGGQSMLSPRGQQLFAMLDSNGNGQVSQAEFESALTSAGVDPTTADAIFQKPDANGDGTVGQDELATAMHHHHHHHHSSGGATADASSSPNPLTSLLEADAASLEASDGTTAPAASAAI